MSDWSPGQYKAVIQPGTTVITNNFGEPEMHIPIDIQGNKRTVRVGLGDKWVEENVKKLEVIGFNDDFASPQFSQSEIVVEMWLGKTPAPTEKYPNPKPFQNWSLPRPPKAGKQVTPAGADAISKLNATVRALKSSAPVAPPPPPPTAPPPQSVVKSDKASCWAEVHREGQRVGATPERIAETFSAAYSKVANGRSEDQFTPQDWLSVRTHAMVELSGLPV